MSSITERSRAMSLNGIDFQKTIRDTVTVAIPIFGQEVAAGKDYISAIITTIVFFVMQLGIRFLKANGVEVQGKQ